MKFEISDEKPIFIQIADSLKDAIISGTYAEETQIPSITEYSVMYKINPATALKGINILVDDGLLYKKRGIGMFVSAGAKEKLLGEAQNVFFDEKVMPVVRDAKKLNIELNELLKMMERGYTNGN